MDISFVIPAYNEQESIPILANKIAGTMKKDMPEKTYEILFIDDGSSDSTLAIIKDLIAVYTNIHYIAFRRNFGKSMALQAGFRNAAGDIVITMDADLQDNPDDIMNFINKLDEGYDMVSGWKRKRLDSAEKRLPSKFFNRYVAKHSGIPLHDFNCGFKAYRKEVVNSLDIYGELHRFIPVLAKRNGFRIGEVEVNHQKREFGKSKYGFERYLRGMFDSVSVMFLLKHREQPMYFFGRIGLVSGVLGFLICLYLLILEISGTPVGEKPTLILGVLLIILGALFICVGLLGDLIVDRGYRNHNREHHIKEKDVS